MVIDWFSTQFSPIGTTILPQGSRDFRFSLPLPSRAYTGDSFKCQTGTSVRKDPGLEIKLGTLRQCYIIHRVRTVLAGATPPEISSESTRQRADLGNFQCKPPCPGLYHVPPE